MGTQPPPLKGAQSTIFGPRLLWQNCRPSHLLLSSYQTLSRGCQHYTPCLRKRPTFACYNFDAHEWILIFFGRNVTDKVCNQKTLYCATSNNLCFCTTWQNGEIRKSHFHSIGLCYTHNAAMRCLPERKNCHLLLCLIACDIC